MGFACLFVADKSITRHVSGFFVIWIKAFSVTRCVQPLPEMHSGYHSQDVVSLWRRYDRVSDGEALHFYPGKHPCEKPADMLRQIINASSRPGDLVADFFMGSGSTIKAALSLGRRAIGIELEEARFTQTVREIERLQNATSKQ